VRLWFDEDLSPTLVQVAHELGLEATCNRDRGALGAKDPQLRRLVQEQGFVFVTDNAADFRPMYERGAVHPGLIVIPAAYGRARQQALARAVITWIINAASAADETAADFMAGKLVEIEVEGAVSAKNLS
jgi:predicted nuclease of predicted toxin-antitoxin system